MAPMTPHAASPRERRRPIRFRAGHQRRRENSGARVRRAAQELRRQPRAGRRRLHGRAGLDVRLLRLQRRRQDDDDAHRAWGCVRADAGEVRWRGAPLDQEARRRVGYMPEERGLYPKMKVGEQVTYFARLHGLDAAAAARAQRGVDRAGSGSGERRGDPVEKLSLGNQQRVQLAAALVQPARGAHPRRAVLRTRPGRRRLPRRGARSSRSGRASRWCSPATSSTWSSGCATRSASSPAAAWSPPARSRSCAAGRAAGSCGSSSRTPRTDGPTRCPASASSPSRTGDTLLELAADTDDQSVLAAAVRTGRVTHFALAAADAGRAVPRGRRGADRGGGGVTAPRTPAAPSSSGSSRAGRSRPGSGTRRS